MDLIIRPGDGLGKISFGMDIEEVTSILGRDYFTKSEYPESQRNGEWRHIVFTSSCFSVDIHFELGVQFIEADKDVSVSLRGIEVKRTSMRTAKRELATAGISSYFDLQPHYLLLPEVCCVLWSSEGKEVTTAAVCSESYFERFILLENFD